MLAIIIPYYKLSFFEATLQSLSKQTDKRFKVYIGDDASPEDPKALLHTFEGQFDFNYHRFEANLGQHALTQQWERCIALSHDEAWLLLLGDDDVLGEQVVAAFYNKQTLFQSKSHVIRFATATLFEDSNTLSAVYTHPEWEHAYTSFYRRLKKETRSSLSEYIFSRESYLRFGFVDYPQASHSDDRAWLEFSNGLPIYTINEAIVYVRLSDLSNTGRTDNIVQKQNAQLLFYNFLVTNRLHCFAKTQRDAVLLKYEKILFYQKRLSFKRCVTLMTVYLIHFKIKGIGRLLKRLIQRVSNS
jgi:glycosyltransferase involved in cell wall biosynthesis